MLRKEILIEQNIFRCSYIGSFIMGFIIVTPGNVFLFLAKIQKRKNIKTLSNLIHNWGSGGARPLVQIQLLYFII
jgi:hypothetical protein